MFYFERKLIPELLPLMWLIAMSHHYKTNLYLRSTTNLQEQQRILGGLFSAPFTSFGGFVCQLRLLLASGFGDHHGSEGRHEAVLQRQL